MWRDILRPIFAWPLRSPLRLFLVAGFLIAGLVACSTATNSDDDPVGDLDQPGPVAAPTADPTTTGPSEADLIAEDTEGRFYDPPAEAYEDAHAFLIAYARPDLDAETWYAEIAPLAHNKLRDRLKKVDPADIPITEVRDTGTATGATDYSAKFEFDTNEKTITVTVVSDGITWWADDVTRPAWYDYDTNERHDPLPGQLPRNPGV